MQALMRTQTTDGLTDITLRVPANDAASVVAGLEGLFALSGHELLPMDEGYNALLNVDDIFPDLSPSMLLREYRGKLDLTQAQLAETMQVTQARISGKRPISIKAAKKLATLFGVPYQIFL